MNKILIGSLIGAILVFGWQSVSHLLMHYHDAGYKRVSNDSVVINTLSSNMQYEGRYYVPGIDMNASADEMQKMSEERAGQPWALITYHPELKEDMIMSSVRSFATAFLCVLILLGILGKNPGGFGAVFFKCLGMGIFAFLFIWYNQNIWMQTPWSVLKGEMYDALIAWGICGIWLGWWLNKRSNLPRKNYGPIV